MTRILITGSKGQLGSDIELQKHSLDRAKFYFFDIEDLDLRKEEKVNEVLTDLKPDYIVNCAAYTAVDKAEDEKEDAFAVNATAVKNIIKSSRLVQGVKIVHISTDFVFDGTKKHPYTETDKPNAISVYGKSKHAGEEYALEHPLTTIIRTSWLYSAQGNNFVRTILRLDSERDEINVVNDQIGSPTWSADLASAILQIIRESEYDKNNYKPGIYHYSNKGECSWFDFANEIKRIKNLDLRINPIPSSEYPMKAERPGYSVLNLDKIINNYNIEIPCWQKSLEECLKRIDY